MLLPLPWHVIQATVSARLRVQRLLWRQLSKLFVVSMQWWHIKYSLLPNMKDRADVYLGEAHLVSNTDGSIVPSVLPLLKCHLISVQGKLVHIIIHNTISACKNASMQWVRVIWAR